MIYDTCSTVKFDLQILQLNEFSTLKRLNFSSNIKWKRKHICNKFRKLQNRFVYTFYSWDSHYWNRNFRIISLRSYTHKCQKKTFYSESRRYSIQIQYTEHFINKKIFFFLFFVIWWLLLAEDSHLGKIFLLVLYTVSRGISVYWCTDWVGAILLSIHIDL